MKRHLNCLCVLFLWWPTDRSYVVRKWDLANKRHRYWPLHRGALWYCDGVMFSTVRIEWLVCQKGMKLYTKLKLISSPPPAPTWLNIHVDSTWRQIQIRLIYSTWCVNLLIRRCDVSGEWIIWSISNTFFLYQNSTWNIYIAPISDVLANNGFDFDELINYHRLVQSWVYVLPLSIVYSNTHLHGGHISDLPNHIHQ